jgi:hypothetical protein
MHELFGLDWLSVRRLLVGLSLAAVSLVDKPLVLVQHLLLSLA